MQFHGPEEVFYIEGSAWITENDSSNVTGGTFGIGNRWMIRDFSQVVGINAFAAWDQTNTGNTYDGAGIGVEWFTDYLSVTANGYIPWGNENINALGPETPDKDSAFFQGTNLAFMAFQPVEEQTAGVDIEVGSTIPRAEFLSAYVGGYHFDAEEGNEFSGVSGRIQMDMTNAIVNLTVSNDDRFGTTVNLGGEVRLGDGPLNFAPRSRNLDRKMFDRARRRSRISTTTYDAETIVIATRPEDGSPHAGLPFEFLHVDNTAGGGGDGSFLDRFDELNDASNIPAADIILVYRGDTTFAGTHLDANGGLFLEDNQIVVGEGYEDFTIVTAQFPGLACPLPGFGDGGTNPFIDGNNNANLINLANNNRILGLNLLPTQDGLGPINVGNAIFGEDITITSSAGVPFIDQINSDLATDAMTPMPTTGSGGGIRLENAAGTAFITDSGFNIDNTDASGGVVVDNTNTADLDIAVINDLTTFPSLVYNGGTAGVSISGDNSDIDVLLMGINSSNSLNGLVQESSNGGNVDLASTGNNFTNAVEDNFNAMIDGGTGTAVLSQTSLADAGQDAVDIFADNGGTFTLTLAESSGDGATENGILATIMGGSNVTLIATDSTFDDAMTGSGIDVTVMEASTFTGSVTSGSFDDAGMNAIGLDVQDAGSNGSLALIDTSGQRAGEDAININAMDASGVNNAVANIILTNSTMFDTATDDGLQITNDGATVNVFADSNPNSIVDFSNFVNGSGLNSVSTGTGALTNINFTDGASFDNVETDLIVMPNVVNNAGDAIFIQSDDGANTMLIGSAISGENAGDDGIDLNSDGGMITVDISAAGSFAEAGQNNGGGDGIDILNDNGGVILLDLDTAAGIADFSGAAQNGLLSASGDTMGVGGTLTTVNFNDGADLSNAGFDAIGITSVDGADTNVTGRNMVGTMAGSDAIELFATDTGSMIDIDFTGTNDFSDALNNGIGSNNFSGGNIDVNIGNADFSETVPMSGRLTGDGLFSNADGTGTSSTFTFNTGAMFNNAGFDAIDLETSDGASNTLLGANLSGTMAGDTGIEIFNTGASDSTTTVTLTGTNDFSDAGVVGILSINSAGDVTVSIGDANFSGAETIGIGSAAVGDTADSMFTFNTGANFDDAGDTATALDSDAGGTNTLNGDMVSGANAGFNAINLNADGTDSDITLTLTNSTDFTNSGDAGLDFTVTDGANIDINLAGTMGTPINFDDLDGMETGFGVMGDVTDSTASLTLNNASFDQTALGGLQVNATDSEFNANIMNTTFNDSNGSGVEFNLDNVTGNPIVLNNVDAMRAGAENSNALANALEINILGGGSNVFNIDDFDGNTAFNNGFEMNVTEVSTLTFDLDDSNFSMAGRNAAEWNADDNSIVVSGILDNLNLSGAGQLGVAVTAVDDGDALQINATNSSRFGVAAMPIVSNIKIDNSDLSGAAGSAMDFMLDGTSEVNVHVDPTDLTGAGGNGVEFDVLGGSLLNLQITDNSDISTAGTPVGENGILGIIDEASTVNLLVDDSQIMNDGALAGDFDAINITADDGSTLNMSLNNVDMTGWSNAGMTMGDGVVLNLTDSNANVMLSGAGTDLSNAGNNAIEINANSGASANQTGSVVMLDLGTDGLSLDGAGDTGLGLLSDGTGSMINVDGDDVSASGTGDLGVGLFATDGGVISLMGSDNLGLNGWVADGNDFGGLAIFADGADSSIFGRFNDLSTINNGAAGTDGSFGIGIAAWNDAEIGNRSTGLAGSAGLIFNNAVSGNFDAMGDPDFLNLVQDHALLVDVDDDAYAGLIFNDSQFDANEQRGVIIQTNEINQDANETALASIFFNGGSISNNGGDGVLLVSDQADTSSDVSMGGMVGDPQSGGINARFQSVDINLNSNAFMQPVAAGDVPDAVEDDDSNGFGIFASAGGADTPSTPGLININLNDVSLFDNEEGELVGTNVDGDIINISFNNMNLNTPIQICADTSNITQSFTDVTISGLTGDQAAISILAEAGFTANVSFNNITIRDVEAQAVAMLAQGGGNIIADFNGLTIDNAGYGLAGVTTDDLSKTGLALEGVIQGSFLAGSTGDINLSGVTIDNVDGMTDAMVATTINVNAVDFEVDGIGATLNLNIAPDAPLGGLTVVGGATTAGNIGGVDMPEGEIDVNATNGAVATINLDDINIADSNSLGINLTNDGSVDSGFVIEDLNDIQATGANQTGFNLVGNLIDNGLAMTPTEVNLTNSNFNNAGQLAPAADGVNINVTATGDTDFTFDNVTAENATDDGLALDVNGLGALANSSVTVTGSDFRGASGGDGIRIDLDGDATSTADVMVIDTIATDAGDDGLFITGNGNTDITAVTINGAMSGVNFGGATGNGVQIDLLDQVNPTDILITDLTANNTGGLGVDINLTNIDGGDSSVSIFNSNVNNTMMATGGGIDINLTNVNDSVLAGTQTILIDNTSAQGAGAADGLNIDVTGLDADETLALTIGNASNFSGNALGGVDLNVTGTDTTVIDLDVNDLTTSNNLMGDGFNFATTMGEDVNVLNFASITSDGNSQDGIDLLFSGGTGSTVTFDGGGTFDSIVSTNNEENGLLIDVAGGSTLSPLVLDGGAPNDFSNNGAGNGFDGIDIRVHDAGSSADFTFNNLTLTGSGGRGIDLDAFDGGDLTFTVDGGMISDSGLQGIDINVGQSDEFPTETPGTAGTFNGTFTDLSVTTSGQSGTFSADNINAVYTAGSDGTLTFDNVTADMADGDGIDILINGGSTAIINVDNGTSASNNANSVSMDGVGLRFTADGAATTASLLMDDTQDINVFNMNEAEGILVNLTSEVMVPDLEIFAQADMNGSDGIVINANDGPGVTITNLDIAGAQANNNTGSGLVVDLNAVLGITDFTLSNATFMDNAGDQVFLGFQDMSLTNLTIDTVTVDGLDAASEDGLEINLNNTDVTNQLMIDTLVATSNGNNGLNLVVFDSNIGDGTFPVADQSMGGVITNSTFSSNGDNFDRTILGQPNDNFAGAKLLFQGDSVVNFDIFDNETGFTNNQGIGLNIQIQDETQFTMAGTNFTGLSQSFFNNNITGNGGFGVLVEASEPNDPNPLDMDGMMPEYELELGDILEDPNTISTNTDANFALIGSNDSIGSFTIVNSIMNDAVNAAGGDSRFNGDGLAVLLEEQAELEALTIDGTAAGLTINGNDGSGLVTSVNGSALLGTDTRFTVLNTTITDNGLHGIDIQRSDNALYGPDAANNMIIIGQTGMGNTLAGNMLNGINIIHRNMPGAAIPLDLEIVDNDFNMNMQDGIFMNGTGNAQFIGNISDNNMMAQGQDGIRVRLENDAALGDPNGAANDPFIMDGNQISGSGRHGIFFDTNFFNEQGVVASGGAFVNVTIRESDTEMNGMGNPVRTLITDNEENGIQIIDNSDFIGMVATNPIIQNTYRVQGTTLSLNGDNGLFLEVGERTANGGPSLGATRGLNNGVALLVGNATTVYNGNFDVLIENNEDDGIDLELRDGDTTRNFFTMDRTTVRINGVNGDNQRNEMGPQNVGHGLEADINNQGNLMLEFNSVDFLQNFGDGMDFSVTSTDRPAGDMRLGTALVVADALFLDVNSSMNGGRGLDVLLEHDTIGTTGSPGSTETNSNWYLGRGNEGIFATAVTNQFNENAREGVVFDVQATSLDQDTVNVANNFPHYNQTDINNDVYVETNLVQNISNTNLVFPSTQHPDQTNGTRGIALVTDIDSTTVKLTANVEVINTEIANNGGFGGFEDGLVFGVGSLTRVNAEIGNASFGGNVGDDIAIYPHRSNEMNPPNSFRDTSNDGNHSFMVYDPVAYIDLVFGAADIDQDGTPDTIAGNGNAATSGTGGIGNGDQIRFLTSGATTTNVITTDGVYNNADPIKPNTRTVRLAGLVQAAVFGAGTTGMSADDETINDFFQNGVQQNLDSIFDNQWIQVNPFMPIEVMGESY